MSVTTENNKRIVKNTIFLYIRMLFIMVVTLYTSRIVLNALGVEDFGIYSVVGGFIMMFALISNSLSVAISRFITFELGSENDSNINSIFSTAVIIQLLISIIVVIMAETVGLWFLNKQMTIPHDRIVAANWVFQLSLLTFVVNLISVPYNACIIAHEKMGAFAYIGLLDALGRLFAAFMITISPIDKLVFYAVLMCLVAILVRLIYGWYCKKNFMECRFRWEWDTRLLKKIFGFAGWNLIGASSGVLRDQGVNVLLNIFCGPVVNASRGIAMQVSTAMMSFSSNFVTVVNPQITKSYAAGNREYLLKLVFQGARFSFYLLLIFSLPILAETHFILKIWLKVVPLYSVNFVRLILICVMIESVSFTMVTLMLATGNIRKYQILVGGCQMLNFPLSYVLLKLGYPPEATIVTAIVIAVCCLFLRLSMLHSMINFPVRNFLHSIVLNILAVCCISSIIPYVITLTVEESTFRFILNTIICVLQAVICVVFVGCSSSERSLIISKIHHIIKKYADR